MCKWSLMPLLLLVPCSIRPWFSKDGIILACHYSTFGIKISFQNNEWFVIPPRCFLLCKNQHHSSSSCARISIIACFSKNGIILAYRYSTPGIKVSFQTQRWFFILPMCLLLCKDPHHRCSNWACLSKNGSTPAYRYSTPGLKVSCQTS